MAETRTRRRKRNRQPLPQVEIRTNVTLEEVHALWDAILRDPSPYYVSDYTPRFFHDLVGQLGRSVVLLGGFIGGELAGGLFITRQEGYPDTSKALHCVVDMYIFEAYRGKGAFALARAWKQYLLETVGFETFFCTIHPEHKASQYLVTQMGMYRVGILPSYVPMRGKAEDVILYSMKHPQKAEVPIG